VARRVGDRRGQRGNLVREAPSSRDFFRVRGEKLIARICVCPSVGEIRFAGAAGLRVCGVLPHVTRRRRREPSRGRSLGRLRCLRAARARAARPELERLRPGSAARAKLLMLRILRRWRIS